MRKQKYISQKTKKVASLFLLLHFIFSPILAAIPTMNCDENCALEMSEMCSVDSHAKEENTVTVDDDLCGCCSYGEMEQVENANSTSQTSDTCDMMFNASECEINSNFVHVDFTITFKYEQKANLTTIATLNETEELFSSENIYSTGLVRLNGPPLYIINSSFLN